MKMKLTKSNKRSLEVLVFFVLPFMTLGFIAIEVIGMIFRGFVA